MIVHRTTVFLSLLVVPIALWVGSPLLAVLCLGVAALTITDGWPDLRPHLRYGLRVLRHKAHVYRAGRALGLGRWQLILHDLSKFSREEWGPYVAYQPYFGRAADAPATVRAAFDAAWRHHWQHNAHHAEHWAEPIHAGDPPGEPLRMPVRYVLELVADLIAMGHEPGMLDAQAYYRQFGARMPLHPETRHAVEACLSMAVERGLIPAEERTT